MELLTTSLLAVEVEAVMVVLVPWLVAVVVQVDFVLQ
jgi:hypothetical protein